MKKKLRSLTFLRLLIERLKSERRLNADEVRLLKKELSSIEHALAVKNFRELRNSIRKFSKHLLKEME